jgi:hypothetical protein
LKSHMCAPRAVSGGKPDPQDRDETKDPVKSHISTICYGMWINRRSANKISVRNKTEDN